MMEQYFGGVMLGSRALSVSLLTAGLVLSACTPVSPPAGQPTAAPTITTTTTTTTVTTPSASPGSSSPGASPTATTARDAQALVYFQIDGPNGPRLVREPHRVDARTPARGAVEAMIAGPDDPDYRGPWNPGTRVLGISDNADVITVDVSGEARTANVGSAFAVLMKQQLIYTVTEQLGRDKRVLLHIDGAPAGELWGVTEWATPEPRGDWSETLLLVGIDTPAENATVPSPVVVTGQAAVFEATLPWRVRAADGAIVQEGFATTSEGMTLAPYRFDVSLPAGEYMIEVTEDDPSGGEGGPLDVDTRRITVTE